MMASTPANTDACNTNSTSITTTTITKNININNNTNTDDINRGRRRQQLVVRHLHHGLRGDRGQLARLVAVEKRHLSGQRDDQKIGAAPRGGWRNYKPMAVDRRVVALVFLWRVAPPVCLAISLGCVTTGRQNERMSCLCDVSGDADACARVSSSSCRCGSGFL